MLSKQLLARHRLVLTETARPRLQKAKCTERILIQEYFTFSFCDLRYIRHVKSNDDVMIQVFILH